MAFYTWFTVQTTAWRFAKVSFPLQAALMFLRTKYRKDANAADNKGATLAVDSLINYEAVKVSQRLLI